MPLEMKQPHFSAETESAIRESREILSGNTPARHYRSAGELFRELDEEENVIDAFACDNRRIPERLQKNKKARL